MRIHTLLDTAARRHPQRTAVVDRSHRWSYQELRQRSVNLAGRFRALGLLPGDRIAVRSGGAGFAAILFAASYADLTLAPLSAMMRPFQLRAVLADIEPALVVGIDPAAVEVSARTWSSGQFREILETLDAPVGDADQTDARRADGGLEAPALLMYTSGSSARPKGVVCPHDSVLFATRAIGQVLGYRPDDVVLSCVPPSFDYGLYQLLLATAAGSRWEALEAGEGIALLERITSAGATVVPVVPEIATALLRLAARTALPVPQPVRMFTNTGARMSPRLADGLRDAFPGAAVVQMYGLTECKRATILEPDGDLERPGSVGRAIPGTVVRVVDRQGRPLPAGDVGEVVVEGANVMAGYWRDRQLSAATFRATAAGRRLHTGDRGHLDVDGHLYLHGRGDDVFKHRGVRSSIAEIEAAAMDIDGVDGAAAVAPDEANPLTVVVATVLPENDVLAELARRLEPAKTPERCVAVHALPLTPHGKVDRQQIRAIARSHPPPTPVQVRIP
ncbi:class I adenylate-forming enzyme family protein [Micromonospora echinofusca]|uniref:Acyl-CoA synthetase (AMP-forming)/AMP-acid ligase II n=1 Tax=Micromonospora echinofusca TaxID=47858 RepID=A0A1C5GAY4_MICEH|nr:class I adenylate-forming enzyme family protein [Micromonospora echinofusca]SCG17049.1 Acyl-CoA synthetase (AMP-forming)/AMP-acid ligase II [Micromonospora echinofusca]